jgi:2-amino-4-hydroxy-6-hydroxymethyldihydropteridine diphosphokinase
MLATVNVSSRMRCDGWRSTETQMGRTSSGERWGPRCIDLDLLAYEDLVMQSPGLQLPHPRMHLRAFVLVPLLELEPGYIIPGAKSANHHLAVLDHQEVSLVVSEN